MACAMFSFHDGGKIMLKGLHLFGERRIDTSNDPDTARRSEEQLLVLKSRISWRLRRVDTLMLHLIPAECNDTETYQK
jgi:hypothetical protein